MTAEQGRAITAIEEQQKALGEFSAPWMVGEQLKEICTREPDKAELIAHDLTVPEMSLVNAEKKIKAWADKQKRTGGGVGVPPNVAEGILREFYGLGEAGKHAEAAGAGVSLNLDDFM
ncbi:hypothetical protein LJC32_06180 [Oscillospiraceae bacterium OttesenSCG-928-F05]|nr:hypothetical protein [Oscillospiraceae bacterium OttesenSCG-928-F05]